MARIDSHEPSDLEMTWGEDDSAPVPHSIPRPRVMDRYESRSWRIVFVSAAVVALIFWMGSCTGSWHGRNVARNAVLELTSVTNTAEQAKEAAAYWQSEATSATAGYQALESDIASMTADLAQWRLYAEEASATISTLKGQIQQQSRKAPAPKPVTPVQVAAQGAWSAGQVEATLRDAAGTEWIVATGLRVAYKESTYRPDAVNPSGCVGLFQFNSAWGSMEQRLDPVWSCYRFVKVYVDGGAAKIAQHWKATV